MFVKLFIKLYNYILGKNISLKYNIPNVYNQIILQSRKKSLFLKFNIPDTIDGRFNFIIIHISLVIKQLRLDKKIGNRLVQILLDMMLSDMDLSLREMGVGDTGIEKRVMSMANAYLARYNEYHYSLLKVSDSNLKEVLIKNIYNGLLPKETHLESIIYYIRIQDQYIKNNGTKSILNNNKIFNNKIE